MIRTHIVAATTTIAEGINKGSGWGTAFFTSGVMGIIASKEIWQNLSYFFMAVAGFLGIVLWIRNWQYGKRNQAAKERADVLAEKEKELNNRLLLAKALVAEAEAAKVRTS